MASFLDGCRFNATSSGSGNFVVASVVNGYQTPASAQAVDGQIYKYRAESGDLSQWEEGYGVYTVSSVTLARTTILFNSSGGTSAISFNTVPQVAIVAYAEDIIPIDGSIFGLTLSTAGSSATFTVATGWAADSTAVNVLRRYTSLAKTTSAWAVGAAGSLDTGAIAASTWYHVYVIKRLDTGVTDILTSLSATAPTMPANYTLKRRIGCMKTDGSSLWTAFTHLGDEFLWASPPLDANAVSVPNGSAALATFSCPLGIQTNVLLEGYGACTAISQAYLSSPDQTDIVTPNGTTVIVTTAGGFGGFSSSIRTNTSSQIRWRANAAAFTINASTRGWIDTRGRFA